MMLKDGSPMTRGKLCVSAVRKSGRKAYNLQYRRKTVQFVKVIPACELEAYRKSTERCKRFLDCVQRYVDMKTKESRVWLLFASRLAPGEAVESLRAESRELLLMAGKSINTASARMQGKTIGA